MNPVLIVDDEKAIADLIEMTLDPFGYDCCKAYSGEEAADLIENRPFDLILLDVMLPGVDGFTLMDYIAPTGTPVIFLTAKTSVEDRVRGLRAGAYDYITKPFAPEELLARVEGLMRHTGRRHQTLRIWGVDIQPETRTVEKDGHPVKLTPREFDLLMVLVYNRGVALYRNRFVTQSSLEQAGEPQQIRQDLLARTEALAQAEALPELVAQRARWILEQPVQEATSKSENGFASATYLIPQKGASGYCSVSARWQEDTGMVVSYIVTADTVLNDLEPCLSAYQVYLQVDDLPDWQVGSRQEGEAWAWSQAGQLSLFCRRETGRFMLGAASQLEPSAAVADL